MASGVIFCTSGVAKLFSGKDPNSLIRKLFARVGFTNHKLIGASEHLLGATECVVGLGQLLPSNSAVVRRSGAVLSLGSAVAIEYGIRREPHASCGCFGNLSKAQVRDSRLRSGFMSAMAALTVLDHSGETADGTQSSTHTIATGVIAASLLAVMWKLSPETEELARIVATRRVRRNLAKRDPASKYLMESHSWNVLAQHVDSSAESDYWFEDEVVCFAFRAKTKARALTVFFQGTPDVQGVRFRGALIDDDSGAVLVAANG